MTSAKRLARTRFNCSIDSADVYRGILGDGVEDGAAQRNAGGAKFGGEFVGGAPFPSVLVADRLKGFFEYREVELRAQGEVRARRFNRIDFARRNSGSGC